MGQINIFCIMLHAESGHDQAGFQLTPAAPALFDHTVHKDSKISSNFTLATFKMVISLFGQDLHTPFALSLFLTGNPLVLCYCYS